MKLILSLIILLCIFVIAAPVALADGEGRYQAILFMRHRFFIIDTKDGHIWIYDYSGKTVTYQGKVKRPSTVKEEFDWQQGDSLEKLPDEDLDKWLEQDRPTKK